MIIKIKLLNGKVTPFEVEPQEKIIDIKVRLQEKQGIEPDQQRLVLNGRPLVDDKTVEESKIKEGAVLNLLLSLRGGY